MTNVTFVTGNANKAKYFAEIIGQQINHYSVDIDEIQSLDLEEVVAHKAKAAYNQLKTPVLVEDTSVIINSMGKLPGPFVKWFIESMGLDEVCKLADFNNDRSAIVGAAFAYYDGKNLKIFKSQLKGRIANEAKGDTGFGWNAIFIPEGSQQTLGQMDQDTFKKYYVQIKPFMQVKEFLASLDKA